MRHPRNQRPKLHTIIPALFALAFGCSKTPANTSQADATTADVTLDAGSGAASDAQTGTTHRKRKRTAPVASARANGPAPKKLGASINPSDPKGRMIYAASDDTCYVLVPPNPPPPPIARKPGEEWLQRETVDCPPAMDDPAWDHCQARLAVDASTNQCFCFDVYGAPPPSPVLTPCPRGVTDAGR